MEYRTRRLVKSEDLNPAGTLFGGRALEWIDEERAVFSMCQLEYPDQLVTKLMSEINFMHPAHNGDIIEIGMKTEKIGTTSITVSCSLRNKKTQLEIVKIDKIVFVNVDKNGKPTPHNVYHTEFGPATASNSKLYADVKEYASKSGECNNDQCKCEEKYCKQRRNRRKSDNETYVDFDNKGMKVDLDGYLNTEKGKEEFKSIADSGFKKPRC